MIYALTLHVSHRIFGSSIADLEFASVQRNKPKMERDVSRLRLPEQPLDLDGIELEDAALRVLRFPAVADKSFLIHIGDRTVGGLTARDQMVGPWQVPVADVAVTASTFTGTTGEAMAMGERTPVAIIDAAANIAPGTEIGLDKDADLERGFRVTEDGITLVTPDMLGQQLHFTR